MGVTKKANPCHFGIGRGIILAMGSMDSFVETTNKLKE
jgi:hypothetical protein